MNEPGSMGQRGQVLAFFAVALPAVLLPAAAYAIDVAFVAQRYGALEAATVQAAEAAVQQIDVGELRRTGRLRTDATAAMAAARRAVTADDPGAAVSSVAVGPSTVTVRTSETIELPLPLFSPTASMAASATARLVPGYDRPNSLLPLPASTF